MKFCNISISSDVIQFKYMFCYFSPKFDQDKSGYVESEILKKKKQTQIAFNSIKCGKKSTSHHNSSL